jgi:PBP1b-binding outer membrane lipoprotein LpoB
MKKTLTLIVSVLLVVVCLAGCGASTTTTSQYKDVKADMSDSMNALVKNMRSEKYIDEEATVTEMSPVKQEDTKGNSGEYGGYLTVGAEEGWRFTFTYNSSNVNLELYRYNSKKLSDTGKSIIDSVKNNGYFNIADTSENIEAYLSEDENFLMIYQDSSTEKKNINKKNKVVKYFQSYKVK